MYVHTYLCTYILSKTKTLKKKQVDHSGPRLIGTPNNRDPDNGSPTVHLK